MGPRILEDIMTDQDYEALRKKLMETFSMQPTLSDPTKKKTVNWHCLVSACFMDNEVFDRREKWMRHHQRVHNRDCPSDRVYPREVEAKQFIHEHERRAGRRENARHVIAGAGGSAGLVPPTATPATPPGPAGPYSSFSGVLNAIPLHSAAPSSSTSGALGGAPPNRAAPNSPSSGALLASSAAGRRGPYRPRANMAARRQKQPDQGFVNVVGTLQDVPESSGPLDDAQREILMQQLRYNLQAVSRINTNSVQIMEILGSKRPRESPNTGAQEYPATTVARPVQLPVWVDGRAPASTSPRARGIRAGQSRFAHAARTSQAPAHLFEAPPYHSQAPAHSNEVPPHPSQALALSIEDRAHSYEAPPISIVDPAHPCEAHALSIEGPAYLGLTNMTPRQPEEEEEEEEENYTAASDSDRVGVDNENQAAGGS